MYTLHFHLLNYFSVYVTPIIANAEKKSILNVAFNSLKGFMKSLEGIREWRTDITGAVDGRGGERS